MVLIGWVGPKVNGLDLGSGLGLNMLGVLVLIGWVGPKVNGLDLGSELGPNRLGWA